MKRHKNISSPNELTSDLRQEAQLALEICLNSVKISPAFNLLKVTQFCLKVHQNAQNMIYITYLFQGLKDAPPPLWVTACIPGTTLQAPSLFTCKVSRSELSLDGMSSWCWTLKTSMSQQISEAWNSKVLHTCAEWKEWIWHPKSEEANLRFSSSHETHLDRVIPVQSPSSSMHYTTRHAE